MSLLERLNHAFSGGIMFVHPTAEKKFAQRKLHYCLRYIKKETSAERTILKVTVNIFYTEDQTFNTDKIILFKTPTAGRNMVLYNLDLIGV